VRLDERNREENCDGVKLIEAAKAAYTYPLLIKQLLHTPMTQSPDREIVYRDLKRMTGS